MHTTLQLIDLAKKRLALRHSVPLPMTDYRLAKLMDIKPNTVSNWRTGKSRIGTEFAANFASACELPKEYVYACIEHERAKDPGVLKILEGIAAAFRGKAAAWTMAILAAGTTLALSPSPAQASALRNSDLTNNIHYMHLHIRFPTL